MVSFNQKIIFLIFAKSPSHYAQLICKVSRNQDFFSCLQKRKIVLLKKEEVFPNSDE